MKREALKFFLSLLLLFSSLEAEDLDNIDLSMDFGDIDKAYSYRGYLKPEFYYIEDKEKYRRFKGELNVEGDYKKREWYFKGNWSGYYISDKYDTQKQGVVNEAYLKYGDISKNITVGKELLKWGKGYAYSAVSFFTREKNPLDPEDLKQGYEVVHLKTIKATGTRIKNYAIDFIYMPVSKVLNSDLQKSQNYGAKFYMLYGDIDIDFMMKHSNALADQFGCDFSFNIVTELESHGEYAFDEKGGSSYLLGLKYASDYDYTVTAELYKEWNKNIFVYTKVSKKDFYIDYFTFYVTAIRNCTKNMNSFLVGGSYDFKNNFIVTVESLASKRVNQIKFSCSYFF